MFLLFILDVGTLRNIQLLAADKTLGNQAAYQEEFVAKEGDSSKQCKTVIGNLSIF